MAESEVQVNHARESGVDVDLKASAGKITEKQGDAHFHETVNRSPLDPWSKTSLQLYLILLVAALNATASGFDGVRSSPFQPYNHFGP